MMRRIAGWALGGALIVSLWSIYLLGVPGAPHGMLAMFLDATCPIAIARLHHLTIDVVLLANALTYALAGLVAETTWRTMKRPVKQTA
jgi:hypothetical protein